MFSWTKASSAGSSHPVNARIFTGLIEILEVTSLSDTQKQNIKILLYEVSKNILKAESRAILVIKEIDEIEARKIHNNNPHVFESVQDLASAIDFLTHAKSSFRNASRTIAIAFNIAPVDGKNIKMLNLMRSKKI